MKLVKTKPVPRPNTLPNDIQLDSDYFSPDGAPLGTCRVTGDSAEHLGIHDRDLLIIALHDRPQSGDLIVERDRDGSRVAKYVPNLFYLASVDGRLLPKRRKARLSTSFLGTVRFVIRQVKEL